MYGLLDLSLWGYLLATAILTQITIASVTLYLHRCQAHRALDLHPLVSHFFRFWLWLTTAQNTKEWAAIHRKHHARCETEDDPHSPQVLGLKKVLLQGAELYQQEARNEETLRKFGYGTPNDWIENNLYSRFKNTGIVLMFLIDLLLFGLPGITVWAVQMMWIPIFAAGVVNGVGHFFGYRNFECPDAARNIIPLGVFIGGEELHNNHHTYGTSAKFSVKWYEVDIGWMYIKLLQWMKLAKVKRLPPQLHHDPKRQKIDLDTLSAVISNRFSLLSQYSREVMLPVVQEERRKAGEASQRLYRRARKVLTREQRWMRRKDHERLHHLLSMNERLQLVHQFRMQLQEIWQRTSSNADDLIKALQEWCHRAEQTGVESLQQFAKRLRSVTPQPAMA